MRYKRSELREKIMVILYQIYLYKKQKIDFEIENVIKENISIEKELLKGGFTSEEIEKVIKEKGNNVSLATTIANIVKAKLEQAKKEWQQELIDKTKGVSGSSNNGDGEESIAIKKAKQSKKQEPPVSWGNYK